MRIAFFLSSLGGSPLQSGLERGLRQLGHEVEDYEPFGGYDLIMVFNQVAHVQPNQPNTRYTFPSFPRCQTPIAFVDCAEYGWMRLHAPAVFDYANAFAPGSMTHDTKITEEQEQLRRFLEGRSFPYFIRECNKAIDWPACYHPIDYPLYHLSEEPRRPDREEYLARDLDLFLWWGGSNPMRAGITDALTNCHTKCEIQIIDRNMIPAMPQSEYFARQRAAKVGVSYDGYGSSSFRLTEVLVRSLLLCGELSIHRHAPLVDGETCVEFSVSRSEANGGVCTSTTVCDRLRAVLADPERSYRIHEAGYDHCYAHYTERATAQYVLDTVAAHDWGKVTELDVCGAQTGPR